MPAVCSRLPALQTVAAAHPVVAAACSEAKCFWNFSLGVASCAVYVDPTKLAHDGETQEYHHSRAYCIPLAVPNLKNKPKEFL